MDRGLKVLYISTDIVPRNMSLFERIEERDSFKAIFLSEEEVKRMWKKRFGREVYDVISSFLPVGEEIIDYVSGAPGISDEFSLYYVWEMWKSCDHDVLIWDTMAAGGSIRLLKLESEFYSHIGEAARLYLKVKTSLESLRRRKSIDPLELIEGWRKMAESILSFLSSEAHEVYIVSNPDSFSFAVTTSLFQDLSLFKIIPRKIIINKVLTESLCPDCYEFEQEREKQKIWLFELRKFSQEVGAGICEIPYISGKNNGVEIAENLSDLIGRCVFR